MILLKLPKDDERVHCPVIIFALESAQKQVVKGLFWKHFPLHGEAFPIFLSFSEKYLTLSSLKYEQEKLGSTNKNMQFTFQVRRYQFQRSGHNSSGSLFKDES